MFEECVAIDAGGVTAVQTLYVPELPDNHDSTLTDMGLYRDGWRMDALEGQGVSDAQHGEDPAYPASKRYMNGYSGKLRAMKRHGEGPHCVLPVSAFGFSEQYQGERFLADECDLF